MRTNAARWIISRLFGLTMHAAVLSSPNTQCHLPHCLQNPSKPDSSSLLGFNLCIKDGTNDIELTVKFPNNERAPQTATCTDSRNLYNRYPSPESNQPRSMAYQTLVAFILSQNFALQNWSLKRHIKPIA